MKRTLLPCRLLAGNAPSFTPTDWLFELKLRPPVFTDLEIDKALDECVL